MFDGPDGGSGSGLVTGVDVCDTFAIDPIERAARNRGYIRDLDGELTRPDPAIESVAEILAVVPPCGDAAVPAEHTAADPRVLTDAELLDTIVGFERLARWVHGNRARLISEFAHRRPGDEPEAATAPTAAAGSRWAPDELGLALGVGRLNAKALLAESVTLTHVLPDTLTALHDGLIEPGKARALTELLAVLTPEQARQVEARVLPKAGGQTWAQFRAGLRRAVLRVDPDGANQRHAAARTDRRVVITPDQDGMSTLWALLSATDAAAGWQMLTRLAHGLGPDDPRPLDARRADLLVDLITGRLTLTNPNPDPDPDPDSDDTDSDDTATDTATATATDTEDLDDVVDLDNINQSRGSEADAGTGDRVADTDQVEGAAGTGATKTGPRRPARCHCASGVARRGGRGDGKPLVQIVVGLDTLNGAHDLPAELVGYGPIPSDLAREAAADAVWKRLVTDPVSGALLDHGRRVYRPPAALDDFVKARDLTCRFPTCNRRAIDSDLDHLQPWADGGTTDPANLNTC